MQGGERLKLMPWHFITFFLKYSLFSGFEWTTDEHRVEAVTFCIWISWLKVDFCKINQSFEVFAELFCFEMRSHHVAQASLKLRNLPASASASRILELKLVHHIWSCQELSCCCVWTIDVLFPFLDREPFSSCEHAQRLMSEVFLSHPPL